MLSPRDFKELDDAIRMVPSNRVNSFNEAKMLDRARTLIGVNDPNAEYKLAQFTSEVQMAKKRAMDKQEPIGPLLDPDSKDYLGKQVQKYISSPQDILHQQAEQARGKVVAPSNEDIALSARKLGMTEKMKLIQQYPMPEEQASESARGNITPTAKPKIPKMEDIATMSMAELSKISPESLPKAERAAAAARWKLLKKLGNK